MKKEASEAGFTLVEIMIALAILAIGLLSLYTAQGNSLRASGQAERMQVAAMLARQVMTEKVLQIEKDMEKGSFPEDKEEETGEFDAPFEEYRWEYAVRKVEIPISGDLGGLGGGEDASSSENTEEPQRGTADNQAPESATRSVAQIVSKKISEAVRELKVKVFWGEEEDQFVMVTTHVSQL